MKRRGIVTVGLALALPALLLGPASAVGSSVGETAPSGGVTNCSGPSILIQTADVGGPAYTTTPGVITSWSVMSALNTAPMRLKVVRPLAVSSYTVTGVSELRTPTPSTLTTFPTRIPVIGGDRLALFLPTAASAPCTFSTSDAGDAVSSDTDAGLTDQPVGGVYSVGAPTTLTRLDLSAVIEPDADGDGFGDLTQDACPSRPDKTTECVPPDTSVTGPKTVRTSNKRVKVKIRLGSEPGATFTCAVDGRKAKPCKSPFKVRLKIGKHRIVVAATDAAGNTDPSPAKLKIRVKSKPRP
jgi:hypothetical protein